MNNIEGLTEVMNDNFFKISIFWDKKNSKEITSNELDSLCCVNDKQLRLLRVLAI